MIDNGLEAVLIKVAGAGLTEKHLGKSLAQMQPTLHKLARFVFLLMRDPGLNSMKCHQRDMFQTHVCGEGGEYETLTLNSVLFKQRIEL